MARPTLTPEQKAEREAEKAAANAHKRTYVKKSETIVNNPPKMQESTQTPATENTVNTQNSVEQNSAPALNEQQQQSTESANNSSHQPNTTYKPFGANAEERGYATPKIDPNLAANEIQEPNFEIPQVDLSQTQPVDFLGTGEQAKQTATQQPNLANPALNQVSDQERKFAAEQMADTMIAGYDKAHALARWFLKKSDEDLYEDHTEGKIDLNIELQLGSGPNGQLTLGQFNTTFNEQIDKEFIVDEAWKNRVRPPLVRICEKNGWGMTDEQTVAFAVIEDVSTKLGLLFGLKKTYNKIYNIYAKINEDKKKELEEIREIELAKKRAAAEEEARIEAQIRAQNKQQVASEKNPIVSSENSKETMSK